MIAHTGVRCHGDDCRNSNINSYNQPPQTYSYEATATATINEKDETNKQQADSQYEATRCMEV
jgi:hypothetical protein